MEYDNNHFIIASRAYSLHEHPCPELHGHDHGGISAAMGQRACAAERCGPSRPPLWVSAPPPCSTPRSGLLLPYSQDPFLDLEVVFMSSDDPRDLSCSDPRDLACCGARQQPLAARPSRASVHPARRGALTRAPAPPGRPSPCVPLGDC
jgi:hypothetical protein